MQCCRAFSCITVLRNVKCILLGAGQTGHVYRADLYLYPDGCTLKFSMNLVVGSIKLTISLAQICHIYCTIIITNMEFAG